MINRLLGNMAAKLLNSFGIRLNQIRSGQNKPRHYISDTFYHYTIFQNATALQMAAGAT